MNNLKIIPARTRWTYKDNSNHNTRSLPDSIQFDLELEEGKVTLNLNKQPERSMKTPLIMTKLDERSIWKPSEEEVSSH